MSSAIPHDLDIRPRRGDDVAEEGRLREEFSIPVRSPYRCDGEAEVAAAPTDADRSGAGEESVSSGKR